MPRGLEILLTIAATALGVAFFASVPYWPKAWTERPLPEATPRPLLGPSVLASLAPAVPVPRLMLPDEFATVVQRLGANGETGLIASAGSVTTFRLDRTGDLVAFSAPLGLDPIRRAPGEAGLLVRGAPALALVERGSTILRWTEGTVTYQLSSRSLDATRLVDVANRLR